MEILGIGTDIINQSRIEGVWRRFGQRFIERILHPLEAERLTTLLSSKQSSYLAKRFAAKEAIAKALGTGIGSIKFKDIAILNTKAGQPYIFSHHKALQNKANMISLSDEATIAIAFAIIYK